MEQQEKSLAAAVIGAGPAGLMAAEQIAKAGFGVTVYERMPSAGRKFLLAGRGGLNLTHGEALEAFMSRYGARAESLRMAIEEFPPAKLRAWSEALGQKTFEGSSGRVFPETFKASPLLRAWLRRLDENGVRFEFRHRWQGWDERGALVFDTPRGRGVAKADATVLALGGGSWPRLGSDGAWTETLARASVAVAPLQPSNCGFLVSWPLQFRERFAGTPLKRIALSSGNVSVRGEATVAQYGLEGGAIYALSASLRDQIRAHGRTTLHVNLRPDLSAAQLAQKLDAPRGKQSFSNFLRKASGLPPVAIGLLQEYAARSGSRLSELPADALSEIIVKLPITLEGVAPIENAISTSGGILFEELDQRLMIRRLPGVFAAGEMLDWEAPTGGYLLQASFATGSAAGSGAVNWLAQR